LEKLGTGGTVGENSFRINAFKALKKGESARLILTIKRLAKLIRFKRAYNKPKVQRARAIIF
jgi:hypothetical protein